MYLAEGTILNNRYVIETVLGHGGFGITYAAHDRTLNVRVAIKEYLPRQLATRGEGKTRVSVFSGEAQQHFAYGLKKFLEEAQSVARFAHHPNVVSARDYFEAHGTAYMVMEYVEGITFKEYLANKGGRIAFEEARDIMMPVMDALREVHQAGMLHRDISPDNIYITTGAQVKILDFGAARYFAGEQSKSLSVILKSGYAPEEQYRSSGKQGAWTDVYAVGATIYKALTGQTPPDALDRMAGETLMPPSRLGVTIPQAAEQALLQALAVIAGQRLQSMGEFQQALLGGEPMAPGEQPTARPASATISTTRPVTAQPPPPTRGPVLVRRKISPSGIAAAIGGGVIGLILLVGLIWWSVGRDFSPKIGGGAQKEEVKKPVIPKLAPPPKKNPDPAPPKEYPQKELLPGMPSVQKPQSAPPQPPPIALGRFQVGMQWQINWQSKFLYQGFLQIRQQLEANQYLSRITISYLNEKNIKRTVSMDGLLTIQGKNVVIRCSNPSVSWWDTDDFYLEWNNDTMTGHNVDTKGRRGSAMFRFVEASSPTAPVPDVSQNPGSIPPEENNRAAANLKEEFSKYADLGDELRIKGDHVKAIVYYDRAINLIPDSGEWIYNNRGLSYLKLGNYQKAVADFDHGLKINPSDGLIYNNRAVAYHGLKDFRRAYGDLLKARQLGHKINQKFFQDVAAAAGQSP